LANQQNFVLAELVRKAQFAEATAALILDPRHKCDTGCCCGDLRESPVIRSELNGSRKAHWNLIQFIRGTLGSWMQYELWKRGVRTEDTEDCQEDILMRWVLEDLSKAHEPAAFRSFLLFKIRDEAREYRKSPDFDFAELIEEVCPAAQPTPEFSDEMERALSQLRPGYADALMLVYVEEYSYEAAAQEFGQMLSTFRKTLERARNALRKELEKIRRERPVQ